MSAAICDEKVAANTVRRIDGFLREIRHADPTAGKWYDEDEMRYAMIAAAIISGCDTIARAIKEASK
jgi:hypothetical protein